MLTLLITLVPPIIILLYFVLADKFREPKGTVILIFFLGFLICLPAGILNGLSHDFFYDGSKYSDNLTSSFLGPAWAEELLKFSILYLIVLKRNEFNEPMDGLVYGVVVSLGFATYENYTYVYEWAEQIAKDEGYDFAELSYLVALGRSYSAIPMHGLNGAVMGYYFGMYAFSGNKKFLILSLVLPYLFHGFYNFLVWPYPMTIIGILVLFSFYLHNELKQKQKLKRNEKEIKKI
ncbi:PrsW family intramembrane metalloprotease [Candidatus Pelagibacter communis]|uniref:PrsW family intramembrane metalloprotease n=1 Tax=Pelagibacter ubique TaxID=198252 RepID=UPI00094D5554|nr:PrsW family intramembrane metalloprotease [Candidatus Pelagibacter ubique]